WGFAGRLILAGENLDFSLRRRRGPELELFWNWPGAPHDAPRRVDPLRGEGSIMLIAPAGRSYGRETHMSATILQQGNDIGTGVRTAPNGIGAPASFSCQPRSAQGTIWRSLRK